jgi:hypothetical protein
MTTILTTAEICDAITATLATATGLNITQSYDELSDGMPDTPALQVYPESGGESLTGESAGGFGSADRLTFNGGVRVAEDLFHADLYARQRAHIGEDMTAVVQYLDAIRAVLYQQKEKLFGLDSIKGVRWRWERVTFSYGDPQVRYAGIRFKFLVKVF